MLSHLKTLFKHSSTTIQLTALIGFQTSWRRRSARRTSASVPRRFVRYETNSSVHGSLRGERSHTNTSSYHHSITTTHLILATADWSLMVGLPRPWRNCGLWSFTTILHFHDLASVMVSTAAVSLTSSTPSSTTPSSTTQIYVSKETSTTLCE